MHDSILIEINIFMNSSEETALPYSGIPINKYRRNDRKSLCSKYHHNYCFGQELLKDFGETVG